jgi:hypothetical protein
LQERLRKIPAPDVRRIPKLIGDLDSNRFVERKRATEELEKLGDVAEPALSDVLRGRPSLEVRRRVERLLQQLEQRGVNPEWLRVLRAVEILEQIGTPEARQVFRALASGASEAPLTCQARAALERLAKRDHFTHRR